MSKTRKEGKRQWKSRTNRRIQRLDALKKEEVREGREEAARLVRRDGALKGGVVRTESIGTIPESVSDGLLRPSSAFLVEDAVKRIVSGASGGEKRGRRGKRLTP
jgi:cobalamin biosynthesis protein CobD/CbiB